jgi:hypothetical protein
MVDFRSRTHKAHLAHQNVPELGQLIELGPAQQLAYSSDPWVVSAGQRSAQVIGVDDHGSEFPNAEGLAELTDSGLAVKYWTAIGELHEKGDQKA